MQMRTTVVNSAKVHDINKYLAAKIIMAAYHDLKKGHFKEKQSARMFFYDKEWFEDVLCNILEKSPVTIRYILRQQKLL